MSFKITSRFYLAADSSKLSTHKLRSSRKYPYSPTEEIGISWGVEFLRKNAFSGGGMDIFCNYTLQLSKQMHCACLQCTVLVYNALFRNNKN